MAETSGQKENIWGARECHAAMSPLGHGCAAFALGLVPRSLICSAWGACNGAPGAGE